jgi:hypothetical protein
MVRLDSPQDAIATDAAGWFKMESLRAYSGILSLKIGGSSLPIFLAVVGLAPASFCRFEVFEKEPQ